MITINATGQASRDSLYCSPSRVCASRVGVGVGGVVGPWFCHILAPNKGLASVVEFTTQWIASGAGYCQPVGTLGQVAG